MLVDHELGGITRVLGDLAQAGAVLGRHAAPALVLVGAGRAGRQAASLEAEVAAGHTGPAVPRPAAAPQALLMAALPSHGAGPAGPARAH